MKAIPKRLLATTIIIYYTALLHSCSDGSEKKTIASVNIKDRSTPFIDYAVVDSFPHDTTSFTEGLLFHNGKLFESTGHADSYPSSRSLFGIVDLKNGRIDTKAEIDKKKYFGEGIIFLKNKIYQLTDTNHIGFIYDEEKLKKIGEFHYEGDGWGLTTNGTSIIMSNGSSNLCYRDPVTFKTIKTLAIADNNGPVSNINELELVNGFIYANQWLTDYILKIDSSSGYVVGKLDVSSLKTLAKSKYPYCAETNGIAYNPVSNELYVTGKLWPVIYALKFGN